MNTLTMNRTVAAALAAIVLTGMIGLIAFVCVDPASSCDLPILDDACTLCSTRQTIDYSLPRPSVLNLRYAFHVPAWLVAAQVSTTTTCVYRPFIPVADPVTSILLPSIVLLV